MLPARGQVAAQPVSSAVVWVPKVSLSMTSLWSLQKVLVPLTPATTGVPTTAKAPFGVALVGAK